MQSDTDSQSSQQPDVPAKVRMYTTRSCPYCMAARSLLSDKGVAFLDIAVDSKPELRAEMTRISGERTVPQIWVGETHVGGYTELAALERGGDLDLLLDA